MVKWCKCSRLPQSLACCREDGEMFTEFNSASIGIELALINVWAFYWKANRKLASVLKRLKTKYSVLRQILSGIRYCPGRKSRSQSLIFLGKRLANERTWCGGGGGCGWWGVGVGWGCGGANGGGESLKALLWRCINLLISWLKGPFRKLHFHRFALRIIGYWCHDSSCCDPNPQSSTLSNEILQSAHEWIWSHWFFINLL